MKDKLFIVELDGVACIIAALIADNDVALLCEKINDLPFSFIAPLRAD